MSRRPESESGETLLELLIALVIMSIAVVAIVGALAASIKVSDVHRKQTTAGTAARSYAEVVKNNAVSGYVACASASAYTTGFPAAPTGFSTPVAQIKYWTGTTWSGTCTTDSGLQQVTLTVASNDGRATERVVLVIRKPCASGC